MTAEQEIREGRLEAALEALQSEVRKKPADARQRIFLFQLLAVLGQWQRALTQLKVAADLDAGTLAMVQTYREAIRCELLRAEVFAGKRSPLVFGQPDEWLALLMEALHLTALGEHAKSQSVREHAFEGAPATAGTIDGTPFEWIADADPRLGPVLEVILNGRYYWVPWHRVHEVRIEEPADLRDMVWAPAEFTWANGGQMVGLIPSRYPGSEQSADGAIRLARKTEWQAQAEEFYLGLGQRLLATDGDEYPLLDVRHIVLDVVAETPAEDRVEQSGESLPGDG